MSKSDQKEYGLTSSEVSKAGERVTIGDSGKTHSWLALGCWAFGGAQWGGQEDEASRSALSAALECGLTHFDTAFAYGKGRSEQIVGSFLKEHDAYEQVFLATKGNTANASGQELIESLETSLENLGVSCVDLYYLHWPRSGKDLRPVMEALEKARSEGKIKGIGVSNFSVEQMEQVSQVCRIDAHQFCYNLFWRFPEQDVMPYCREHGIAAVTYSSIAQGILTGKFPRDPQFKEGDQRPKTVLFDEKVWPHLYEATEELKKLAEEAGRPLTDLAIRWVAAQPGVRSVLVGARDEKQVRQNASAAEGDLSEDILRRMSRISDEAIRHVPDEGNIFRHYP